MKKLFVILLAVALTLSLAAMASAATFSPYVGGEFQLTYTSQSSTNTAPMTLGSGNNSMMKAYVQGRVEDADTNTWAQIGAKLTCWNNSSSSTTEYIVKNDKDLDGDGTNDNYVVVVDNDNNFDLLYSAGIKKVGGIVDIQFTTDDIETTLRGQTPLNNGVYKFGGDPFFTNRLNNAFGFDVNTDSVTVNLAVNAGVNTVNELGKAIVAGGTFKMDAGKVYVGYAILPKETSGSYADLDKSQYLVGAEFKAGSMTIKADYVGASIAKLGNIGTTTRTEAGSAFQGAVSFDEMKLAATVLYDMNYSLVNTSTEKNNFGVGVEYSGFDKLTLGAKYFSTQPNSGMEVYGIYKAGVFDIRPGYAKEGAADGYFYLAAHVGMW